MKKLFLLAVSCSFILTSCLETGTNTAIREDGSGTTTATVDLSEMMKMLAGKQSPGESFKLDTTMYLRDHADTSSVLTARQKELVREMKVRVEMDIKDASKMKFLLTIVNNFKSQQDLTDVGEFMKMKEYDAVFDKAIKIPMLDDDKEGGGMGPENDNMFASIFPSFYHCVYSKGMATCKLDSNLFKQSQASLKKMDIDLTDEMSSQLFGAAKFTNTLTLPSKVKKTEGGEWKQGATDNVLVQKGTLLDIYTNPGKYAYTVQY